MKHLKMIAAGTALSLLCAGAFADAGDYLCVSKYKTTHPTKVVYDYSKPCSSDICTNSDDFLNNPVSPEKKNPLTQYKNHPSIYSIKDSKVQTYKDHNKLIVRAHVWTISDKNSNGTIAKIIQACGPEAILQETVQKKGLDF